MEEYLYHYKAKVSRVIDGDTFVLEWIDLGFNVVLKGIRARLLDVDTMELRDKDAEKKRLAYAAKDFVIDAIDGKTVIIKSVEYDSFGRILAYLWVDGESLGKILLGEGLAVPYE